MPKLSLIPSSVSIELRLVTDGQSDTDTGPSIASRGKKEFFISNSN